MIIALDFDGTCVENNYPEVGKTLPGCIDLLKELVARGDQLILWTNRSEHCLIKAIDWFNDNGIQLSAVNHNIGWALQNIFSPKIYADVYIDDRALGAQFDNNHNINWRWVRQQLGMSAYEEYNDK
jgi:hypothetical protein